jgi:hypothetical protein
MVLAIGSAANAQAPGGAPPRAATANGPNAPEVHAITEEQLRHRLQGKTLYLRGGYFGEELRFDEQGRFTGSSSHVPYTLSMVQIERVHLSKRKVELVGIRYGLHFLGAGPTEDPLSASDKVRITPKKKVLRITIERAEVEHQKKPKHSKGDARRGDALRPTSLTMQSNQPTAQSGAPSASGTETGEDGGPIRSQARANQMLEQALDRVFAPGLDDRMIASLPEFWKLFYEEAAAKTSYKPSDPSVFRQNMVDQKARLLANFEPPSNDQAQAAGVAGVALYHVVVGPDGKAGEIAVGRPIGFGLDENAVASIRKTTFQPAMKDGKPVPVLLDLLVEFRIYSKRTAVGGTEAASAREAEPEAPTLPGPYSANQPQSKQP